MTCSSLEWLTLLLYITFERSQKYLEEQGFTQIKQYFKKKYTITDWNNQFINENIIATKVIYFE